MNTRQSDTTAKRQDQAEWNGCGTCKHFDLKSYACPAFPDHIPMAFASGDVAHTVVIPGQKADIVYDPR